MRRWLLLLPEAPPPPPKPPTLELRINGVLVKTQLGGLFYSVNVTRSATTVANADLITVRVIP